MIRTCNGADPNLHTEGGAVGNCGRTFDDVNHWTSCPHDEFPVNPNVLSFLKAGGVHAETNPTMADLGGDTVQIVPGDPAATDPAGAGRKLIGPPHAHRDGPCGDDCYEPAGATVNGESGPPSGHHQHDDGSWHPDHDAPGDPAGAEAADPRPDRDRISSAVDRYLAAVHAMQTATRFEMEHGGRAAEPKHLRVGIDTAKVEQGALARLLIAKGVFTEVEYTEAMADAAWEEVDRRQEALSTQLGVQVNLR